MKITDILAKKAVIAAADIDNLQDAVNSQAAAVLLMNIGLTELLGHEFQRIRNIKPILIHFDLIKGLSNDSEAVRFISRIIKPAGITSTKGPIIRAAKKEGLLTIQRVFLIDTMSLQNAITTIKENNPDAIEVMPAIAPSIVGAFKQKINQPIILAGLITNSAQINEALMAGADGVSLSKKSLWNVELGS
ncbi:MAG: glycerol-3-phosphate responsive antiterminator [Clostridiaceae bacterium]|jgi:glycerol uptake operon antiterminator|nr:glycerol-3-phosphate responsive antiterminator [Clostridiaceae bacterium]